MQSENTTGSEREHNSSAGRAEEWEYEEPDFYLAGLIIMGVVGYAVGYLLHASRAASS